MGLSKIQFNLLGLLKFNKDTVVFSETELVETINHLQSSLNFELLLDKQNNSFSEHILYNIFEIDRQIIEEEFRERYWQDNPGKQVIYEFSLDKCLIGYYHHRIIFYCDLRVANSEHIYRGVRKILTCIGNKYINKFINKISELNIRDEGNISYCYSYPLMIIVNPRINKTNKYIPFVFSNKTTTMSFNIHEDGIQFLQSIYVRISIPGTSVYAKRPIKAHLYTGLVNSIYQHCLYYKKNNYDNSSEINEEQLVQLWDHISDNLGGKTSDFIISYFTKIMLFVGIMTLLIGLIGLEPLLQKFVLSLIN